MSEKEARSAILADYPVPIEIVSRYPSLLSYPYIFLLLDCHGSYERWAARLGYTVPAFEFGIGKQGTLWRRFNDEVLDPLRARIRDARKPRR
jgi:hypothetical protein